MKVLVQIEVESVSGKYGMPSFDEMRNLILSHFQFDQNEIINGHPMSYKLESLKVTKID